MTRKIWIFLQLLTYGILSYALMGDKVRTVEQSEFRSAVAIVRKDYDFNLRQSRIFGTGSLISKKLVLTAASGLLKKKPSEIEIIAGHINVHYGYIYEAESWITYVEWKEGKREDVPSLHDIAIIILRAEGVANQKIPPVKLFPIATLDLDNKTVAMAGWGATSSGKKPKVLKSAKLRILPKEECNERGTKMRQRPFKVPPYYFCSMAKPWVLSAAGDGGGPVFLQGRLIGINVGTTPALSRPENNDTWSNEVLMNSHLRLDYYENFIKQLMDKYK